MRAQRLTDSAAGALARVTTGAQFAPVGEALMWLIALEDLVVAVDGRYWALRNADVDGDVLPGVRYARNAVVHGRTVTATLYAHGGAMLGAAMLGTFALGEVPSTRWSARAAIGFTPTPTPHVPAQEHSYDVAIAGQHVLAPLERALTFLRSAVGT